MATKTKTITICMGSSCFSRGNKKLVHMIQEYIKDHKLEDEVVLKGAHCMGSCEKGPIMMFEQEPVYHITEANIIDILSENLNTPPL